MSLASLSLSTFSAFQAPVTKTTAPTPVSNRQGSEQEDHDRSAHQTFRQNTLVSALMTAFQALGLAPVNNAAAAPSADAAVTAAPAADTSVVSSQTTATVAPATPVVAAASAVPVTETSGVSTDAVPAAAAGSTAVVDTPAPGATLEKAVNAFAHALYSVMSGRGRDEHEHHGGGHRMHGGGYNGFAQRLEQLAQSLGASGTPAASGAAVAPTSVSASSVPAVTTGTSVAASPDSAATPTDTVTTATAPTTATTHSRGMDRLLAAFTQVMSLLQPPATPADAASAPATTTETTPPVASTADGMTQKLQLFLHTLSQALQTSQAEAFPSSLGSRVNATV